MLFLSTADMKCSRPWTVNHMRVIHLYTSKQASPVSPWRNVVATTENGCNMESDAANQEARGRGSGEGTVRTGFFGPISVVLRNSLAENYHEISMYVK